MGYINTDQCDCCKEIWNRINLHYIPLQSKTLIMCDDCLLEFNHCFVNVHKIDKAIEEMENLETTILGETYDDGVADCLEIIDKYKAETEGEE